MAFSGPIGEKWRLAILLVLRLTADRKIMGAHANGWITNTVLGLIAASTLYLAFQGATEFLGAAGSLR